MERKVDQQFENVIFDTWHNGKLKFYLLIVLFADYINDYKARGDCTQNNDSSIGNEMMEIEDSKDVEVDQDLFQAIQTATEVAVDERKSLSKANKENQPWKQISPQTETWVDDDDEVDNANDVEVSNVYFDYPDLSQDEDELEEDDGDVVGQNV